MLDTYEEPDCAMEAAMVKVIESEVFIFSHLRFLIKSIYFAGF